MGVLLTSGLGLGLRALGSGGRTAVGSYDQIARWLRQNLSPEHASLLAEPSLRSGTFDWFADFDATSRPVRIPDADPKLRQEASARLGALASDIEARASTLQRSDRQDERILGQMLSNALEIPDESHVFVLDGRPVLTFWGHHKDQGQPAINPLKAIIRRRQKQGDETSQLRLDPPGDGIEMRRPESPRSPAASAAISPPAALLWSVFAALLAVIGLMLLRSCAIGFPDALTGWVLDYCPAGADSGLAAALDDERARQDALRAEYEELLRRSDLKRQACFIKPSPPSETPPPKPVPPPPPPLEQVPPPPPPAPSPSPIEKMQLDPKPDPKNLKNIKGCWKAHDKLNEIRDHKDTGQTVSVVFCFNQDGSGSRTIKYDKDGAECRAPARARFEGETLVIDSEVARCDGDHGPFSATQTKCKRAEDGSATCDEYNSDDPSPDFQAFPFIRTEQP